MHAGKGDLTMRVAAKYPAARAADAHRRIEADGCRRGEARKGRSLQLGGCLPASKATVSMDYMLREVGQRGPSVAKKLSPRPLSLKLNVQ